MIKFDLNNRVAIITGGAQGFGLATARRLAEEGAAVALVDIKVDKVNAAAASLVSEGLNAIAVKADVSDENATIRMLDEAEQVFGELNFIHQNAAIQVEKLLHETTLDEWDRLMAVNLRSMFLGAKHILLERWSPTPNIRSFFVQKRFGNSRRQHQLLCYFSNSIVDSSSCSA